MDRRDELARQAEEAEGNLYKFIQLFWPVVEPAKPFLHGWPIGAIAEHLEAVSSGDIKRLLINVPPGHLKEIHVDEPVLTTRGRIKLGDVVIGDMVLTHKGRFRRVLDVADKGARPTLLITTNADRRIRAEINHPFLTPEGWIKAKDLSIGQALAAVVPQEDLPQENVTVEEARLLGYIIGDGSVTNSPGFVNADEEILCDFERCCLSVGAIPTRRRMSPSAVKKNAKFTTIGIKKLLPWLEKWNLRGKNSYTKRIPPGILMSSKEIIANFLGAYWSCDGTIRVRHHGRRGDIFIASLTSVSEGLARDCQHAMLRLGISTRIRKGTIKFKSKRQGDIYTFWNVVSTSHEEVAKFTRLKGLCSRKFMPAQSLLKQSFEQGSLIEDKIISIEDAGFGECRCLNVDEDHSFTANDIAVKNSLSTNVFFPAFEWTKRPHLRYLAMSYSQSLTLRDNIRFRQVIKSPIYQQFWGHVFQPSEDQFNIIKVMNNKTGFKLASSVGGVGTGERGNRLVVDDANNVKEAESETILESTNQWFKEVLPTRLVDMQNDAIIVIQQRTSELDVSGTILDSPHDMGYTHLFVPLEYEVGRQCVTVLKWDKNGEPEKIWQDPRGCDDNGISLTEPGISGLEGEERAQHMAERAAELESREGEIAFPELLPRETVDQLKADLGPFGVAGQLQQIPVKRGGAILRSEWWQPWPPPGYIPREEGKIPLPDMELVVASLDSAYENKKENDFSALTIWGLWRGSGGPASHTMLIPDRNWVSRKRSQVFRPMTPDASRTEDKDGHIVVITPEDEHPKLMLMYAWQKRLDLHGPPEMRPSNVTDREWNGPQWRAERQKHWGLVEWVVDTCRRYKVDTLLIEAKASGISVCQELQKLYANERFSVVRVRPQKDKVARAHSIVPVFSNGIIYAPMDPQTGAPMTTWASQVISQAASFPRGKKDLVDSAVQAIFYLRKMGLIVRTDEHEFSFREQLKLPGRSGSGALYPV